LLTFPRIAALVAAAASVAANTAGAASQGELVYRKTCVVCHSEGMLGAPRLGDSRAWAPRLAAGKEALVASVRNGKGEMPPKGGNPKFTDEDLRAAVDYIVSKMR